MQNDGVGTQHEARSEADRVTCYVVTTGASISNIALSRLAVGGCLTALSEVSVPGEDQLEVASGGEPNAPPVDGVSVAGRE